MANTPGPIDPRRHLLLTFPELELEHDSTVVVDALVEAAAHEYIRSPSARSPTLARDVVQQIQSTAALEYEQAEVIAALERLAGKGRLTFVDEGHHGFVFADQRLAELDNRARLREEADDLARQEWFNHLRQRCPLSEADLAALWHGLMQYFASLAHSHAAEAAAYLYLNDEMDQVRFYNVLTSKAPIVAECVPASLAVVAEAEFPAFFDASSPTRIAFIADRLRTAFFVNLLAIDPSAAALVQESVAGKVLYLDTNVIYRLLGFQGPALVHSPATALTVSTRLGCTIRVAKQTVAEFIHALRSDVGRLANHPIERAAYQRIAASHHADEWAFMHAYYREIASGRVRSVREFESKYSNIHEHLKAWGVEVDDAAELTTELKGDHAFTDAVSQLNQWHNQQKSLATIEHDVFMLHHIRSIRGPEDISAKRTSCWLLTYDRRLTAYAAYHATKDQLPPCMLGDSWLQLTRPFLPRTEGFEQALAAALQRPSLYQDPDAVPFEHVVQALSRLDRYQEIPANVVAAMMADGEFVKRLRESRDQVAEREVLELKLAEMATTLERDSKDLKAKLLGSEEKNAILQGSVDAAEAEKRRAEEGMAALQVKLRAVEDRLLGVIEANRQSAAQERQALDDAAKSRWRKLIGWVIYGAASLVVVGVFTTLAAARWGTESPKWFWVSAGWVGLILLALLAVPFRDRSGRVWAALGVIATLLGLAGLTYQLLSEPRGGTDPSDRPAVTPPQPGNSPPLPADTSKVGGR